MILANGHPSHRFSDSSHIQFGNLWNGKIFDLRMQTHYTEDKAHEFAHACRQWHPKRMETRRVVVKKLPL